MVFPAATSVVVVVVVIVIVFVAVAVAVVVAKQHVCSRRVQTAQVGSDPARAARKFNLIVVPAWSMNKPWPPPPAIASAACPGGPSWIRLTIPGCSEHSEASLENDFRVFN